jgi:hypothetical protein
MGPLDRREAVEAALARMMSHPSGQRPFVVLECSQTHVFVQFRGSTSESLLFDVPLLDRQVDFGLPTLTRDDSIYREATRLAFDTLDALQRSSRQALGLQPSGEILLEESIDEEQRVRN